MVNKKALILEACKIAEIDRNKLNDSQKRFVDKIFSLLITKCNQENKQIHSISESLKAINEIIKEEYHLLEQ